MISIVVCSVNATLLERFKKNVAATTRSAYEVIAFDNNKLKKSICAIYNMGIDAARYDIICFCHEDIFFETENWDIALREIVMIEDIGLAGVSGAVYKSVYPTSWVSVPSKYYRSNIVKVGNIPMRAILSSGSYSEVVVLDGCMIAGRKNIFRQFKWNETLLKGFHLYDLDISLRVLEKYKIVVANQIKITHLSEGKMDADWLKESEKFHSYYRNKLPVSIVAITSAEKKQLEYFAVKAYFFIAATLKESFFKKLGIICKAIFQSPFKRDNLSMLKYLCFGGQK